MIILIAVVVILVISLGIVLIRLRAAKRAEYINTFSLPPAIFERVQKRRPELSAKDWHLVNKGLRQFYMAYLKSGCKYVAMPSQVADDLWHEFILYTYHYKRFCQKAFGGFLHHTPAVALKKSRQNNSGLRRCWWYACKDELINPRRPSRLPLLFALDAKLNIADGFRYVTDCASARLDGDDAGSLVYCGGDFSDVSIDGTLDGFDSIFSSDSDSSASDAGCSGG